MFKQNTSLLNGMFTNLTAMWKRVIIYYPDRLQGTVSKYEVK